MKLINYASEAFGHDENEAWPRLSHHFVLELMYKNGTGSIDTQRFHRITGVDLPSFEFDTDVYNQYNRKRVIHRKLNYTSFNVEFYDTNDNSFVNLMSHYMGKFYHGGSGIDGHNKKSDDSVINEFLDTDKGFTPHIDKYFFTEAHVIQADNKNENANKWTMHNPVVTAFSGDKLNYSSSDPVRWSMTLMPEYVTLEVVKNDIGGDTIIDSNVSPINFEK